MAEKHVVVDGSNIATEGRSRPSLVQLDEAVRAFLKEHSHDHLTVVVDATFGHRIEADERQAFEDAIDAGELITPPAGAIGRGDAFVLEIADRADATVLSNDSFQEFHGEYEWLFDEGRLIGGKPVPGVGWIFLLRTPVRGPTSRRAVSEAKRKRGGRKAKAAPKAEEAARGSRRRSKKAAAAATSGAASGSSRRGSGRAAAASNGGGRSSSDGDRGATDARAAKRRGGGNEPEPYNEPLPFIEFVAAHPVGTTVEGEIERFSSHGAYVIADGARCYLALKAMGDPPPTSPKEVVSLGQTLTFVVQSIDTPRRGVDLAFPGFADLEAGEGPSEATVPEPSTPKEERVAVKKAAKSATKKKATARKSAAKKSAAKRSTAKKSTAKRAAAKKSTAKKAAAKKSTAKKATKKSTAKKSAKKSTAKRSAKKSTAKKAAKKKSAAKRSAKKSTAKKRS